MRPFEGLKVIDLSHVLAGPFAAYQLALFGAEVIKIENPRDPDMARSQGTDRAMNGLGLGTNFLTQGSNKRTMTLDLKTPEGREILLEMAATADVLVENYSPGALTRLGLGYADLVEVNPRLIYCSISGCGQEGPRSRLRAYDHVIQAWAGVMATTGTPETTPQRVGFPVLDYATGTMAAFALASALFQRERTGKSQHIDLAMTDVALAMMSSTVTGQLWSGVEYKAPGNGHALSGNCAFDTADGMIMLGANDCKQHERLFHAIGHDAIAERNDWNERLDFAAEEKAVLKQEMAKRSADEWEAYLQAQRVPAGRVRKLSEALEDPQLAHRDIIHCIPQPEGFARDLQVPMAAFRLEHGGPQIDSPPARLGQHTDEILRALGYSDDRIAGLRARNVV